MVMGLKVGWIVAKRYARQFFGVSTDWRDLPLNARQGRDLIIPGDNMIVEVMLPVKNFPLTKTEWNNLIAPVLYR